MCASDWNNAWNPKPEKTGILFITGHSNRHTSARITDEMPGVKNNLLTKNNTNINELASIFSYTYLQHQ